MTDLIAAFDFIELYPDCVPAVVCADIVSAFERAESAPGRVGDGLVLSSLKSSDDIAISHRADWRPLEGILVLAALRAFCAYARKYPHVLIGAVTLWRTRGDGSRAQITADEVTRMDDEELSGLLGTVFRSGPVNLQRYRQRVGGYPHWHSEIFPGPPQGNELRRVLFWMVYLNDVTEGGTTDFFYQERQIRPRRGSVLIAPAGFTHTHRGAMPLSDDKYVATSWFVYRPRDQR